MAIDARTMLLLTLGIAVLAASFLWIEWRTLRDRSLLLWSAGFAAVAIGCALSPLREAGFFVLGLWTAHGLLVIAHLLFLFGAALFVKRPITPLWWAVTAPWMVVVLTNPAAAPNKDMLGMLQSAVVTTLALRAAFLLLNSQGKERVSVQLGVVLLLHGSWYAIKTVLVLLPGAYVDVTSYKGFLIPLSLFEGIMVEVLLALLMVASVRRRRELEIEALAQRDPLTGVYNRRAFEERAADALRRAAVGAEAGALMLLDVDRFKSINDSHGHIAGDGILIALTKAIAPLLPQDAMLARLGGDEFVILHIAAGEEQVHEIGTSMRSCFTDACSGLENSPSATISIGIATFAGHAKLPELISVADAALYEAKRRGRDQHCTRSVNALLAFRSSAERSPAYQVNSAAAAA